MGLFGAQLDHAHDSYIYTHFLASPWLQNVGTSADLKNTHRDLKQPHHSNETSCFCSQNLPNRSSNQSTKSVLDAMWSPCLSRACFMCAFLGRLGRALGELGGGCGVVVPDAFSCRSMPEWAAFLEAVTQNRHQNFQEDPLLALHAQDRFLPGCSTCI